MVTKRDRVILNEAATYANARAGERGEVDIATVEALREDLGLNKGDIDERLGKSSNWYATHSRGDGTHVFSRADLLRVQDLLELEYLREMAGISESDVDRGVNKPRGWYADQFARGFKIHDFATVSTFLAAVVALEHELGTVTDEQLQEAIAAGVLDEALVEHVRSVVELDYPAG